MTHLVVVDEGSNQIKTVWFDHESGKIASSVMPSRVIRGKEVDEDGFISDGAYEVEPRKFYSVVENDHEKGLPTMGREYQVSNINAALTYEALRREFANRDIELLVTLPIAQFFNEDNTRNSDRIQEKINRLGHPPVNVNRKPMPRIATIDVMPEGIPVWYDILFDNDIMFQSKYKDAEKVLIVDIGGTTFDMTLITGTGKILAKKGVEVGCFDIAKNLRGIINVLSVSNIAIEKAMRTRLFRGDDISGELLEASDPVAEHIYQEMKIFEKDPQSLDYVVYAGGGANLIGKQLEKYYGGNTLIPKEPELAVGRGILKRKMVARMQAEAKEKAEV